MLARVTYGLVGLALATLIAGFFIDANNALLYVSIALSVAAIVLVLVGAARRAREAPAADLGGEAFAGFDTEDREEEDEELPEEVLAAFEDDDEEYEEDEEEPEEEEEPAPRRAAAKTKTKAKPKPKAKPAAKKKAAAAKGKTTEKVVVVPGRDRYHLEGCRFVRDKDSDELEEITASTAKRRGYEPCSVCNP